MLPPGSPISNVSATDLRSRRVTLSWLDHNPVVDDYVVTYDDKTQISTMKKLVVTGLKPFTSYNFTVQARNSAGQSNISSGSFILIKTGESGTIVIVHIQTKCEALFI